MAGKPKKRIDYAGWSVDMFSNDTKIDKLLDAQGWVGFGIYFYLCQMSYSGEGYYYEWGYDLCATTARKMGGGVGAGTVKETVDYCLQIGLFDKRLFDGWGVLTSRGIQKSYLIVLKSKNRQGTEVYTEFWLLDKNDKDCQGVLFVHKNGDKNIEHDHSLGVNDNSLEENGHLLEQKDSKVKDSKVKDSKVKKGAGEVLYFQNDENLNQAFADYVCMRKEIKKPMTDRAIELAIKKLESLAYENEVMNNDVAIEILEQSILGSWQGLFPLKNDKQQNQKKGVDWEKI